MSAPSIAKVGYSINVKVNNSTWSWSQSTEILSFSSDYQVNGEGKSIKYVSIKGFAGNEFKETSHSKNGSLMGEGKLTVKSLEEYINIEEHVDQNSNRYIAVINESIPTAITQSDDLFYEGDGIYSNNRYASNNDIICTDYMANKLSKSVRYAGVYSNSIIYSEVTPLSASPYIMRNASVAFRSSSISDKYSAFSYSSEKGRWEDDYYGLFKISKSILRLDKFNLLEVEDGLGCCEVSEPRGYDLTPNVSGM